MTVTKAELADHLCDSIGMSKRAALELVDGFFVTIRQMLARGEPVLLSGFGRFTLREKRSRRTAQPLPGATVARCNRPGRNFQTGESALIAARRVVTFSASLDLRKRCHIGKDSALDER